MNGKKMACVVLLMILAGVAYAAQIMQHRSDAMVQEANAAGTDAGTAQTQCVVAQTNLTKLEFESAELRQFLKEWDPAIRRVQSSQDADQALQNMLRTSGILTISQKFELKDAKDGKM